MTYEWLQVESKLDGLQPPPRHVVYTINGAGGVMDVGYQADIARALDDEKFFWQPVGYADPPFPMKSGIDAGTAEFVRLLTEVHPTGTFTGVFYSEGAIIGSNVYDMLRDPTSPIGHRRNDFVAAVTFGNPRREAKHRFNMPGAIDPGGQGIVPPNLVNTEDFWWDFANPGDLYTTCDGATGQTLIDMRAVWSFVYNVWDGVVSLTGEILKLLADPTRLTPAIVALIYALEFGVQGLAPHVDYQITTPIPGNPNSCWQLGLNYMQWVGQNIPARA